MGQVFRDVSDLAFRVGSSEEGGHISGGYSKSLRIKMDKKLETETEAGISDWSIVSSAYERHVGISRV